MDGTVTISVIAFNGTVSRNTQQTGNGEMEMANKYAGKCADCGARVPAYAGRLLKISGKWAVAHLGCNPTTDAQYKAREDNQRNSNLWLTHMNPKSVVTTFNSGESVMVNRGGRCEDSPCCGCCS